MADLSLTFPHAIDHMPRPWGYDNPRRGRLRVMVAAGAGLAGLVLLLFAIFALQRWGGSNFHVVVDGEWYRCAQTTPDELETRIRLHGIKTVLALRGSNPDDGDDWAEPERKAAERGGAKLVIAKMATSRLPWRSELRTLFEALDHVETPVLVHCKQGSDRTGLVSTIWLHDYKGVPLDEARAQMAFLPYMHFAYGDAAAVNKLLDDYAAWQREHPGDQTRIRDWVKAHWFVEKTGRELEPWYDGVMYRP